MIHYSISYQNQKFQNDIYMKVHGFTYEALHTFYLFKVDVIIFVEKCTSSFAALFNQQMLSTHMSKWCREIVHLFQFQFIRSSRGKVYLFLIGFSAKFAFCLGTAFCSPAE
jgi:hypothetical protein